MFERLKKIRPIFIIFILVEITMLSVRYIVTGPMHLTMDVLLILGNIVMLIILFDYFEEVKQKRLLDTSSVIGKSAQTAYLLGEIGLLTYNDDFEITWISELLEERHYDVIGQRIMNWLPETKALFNSEVDSVHISINENIYAVFRPIGEHTLIFKDITDLKKAQDESAKKQIVLGLLHFDNYEETTQYEDEHRVTLIDSKIRQAVYRWANSMGIFIKRLRNNRFLLVLNEQLLDNAIMDHFSILENIRKESDDLDIAITLSMAFARGSLDFSSLEEMVTHALELAQSRGGDQVAIKTLNEDVVYLGGSTEAQEKRSKVRARVIAQSLREIILNASNVIIMGHKEMDFDCFGATLAMSRFVSGYAKPVSIVMHGGLEIKLERVFNQVGDQLKINHSFISDHEALAQVDEKTVLILVDHHLESYTAQPKLLEKVKQIVVIDHHRRNQDYTFDPMLVYTETSASSSCEMATELLPYHQHPMMISDLEATLILTGIVVDTNRFRNRTGSRTFEVASLLKHYGADSSLSDEFLKDTFEDFQQKTQILKNQRFIHKGILVAAADEEFITNRSILSQVADTLLTVDSVQADFVISHINERTVGVSARSNGTLNVHAIMEKMQGSGHFTAAALQRENTSVEAILNELIQVVETECKDEVCE